MEEERKHYVIISSILLSISGLLLLKSLPNVIIRNLSSEFIWDLLGLLWPVMGISVAVEFLLGDKWGFGGLLFHFIVPYSMFYYLYLSIQAIITITFVGTFFIDLSVCVLGWIVFLLYYD